MAKELLREFFYKDNIVDSISGKKRISAYLTIRRDLKKIMTSNRDNLGLSYLTNISLICTSVDLLSKVSIAREPKRGENRAIFEKYLISYCNFSKEESASLWRLRNTTLHSFTIDTVKGIILYGTNSPILINDTGEKISITFNLRRLYSEVVVTSAKKLEDYLINEVEDSKPYEEYLLQHGFFYRQF